MKKAVAVLLTVLLIALTGCAINMAPEKVDESGNQSADTTKYPPATYPPDFTEKDANALIKSFKKEMKSLHNEKIVKFQMDYLTPSKDIPYVTEDQEVIDRWVTLLEKLGKMKTFAEPYEGYGGVGYGLSYYTEDETEHNLFVIGFPKVYYKDTRALLEMNYDKKWLDEFQKLKKEMGMRG